MLFPVLHFTSLLSLAHAFSKDDLFIKEDVLKSPDVQHCDLGYVFEGKIPQIMNEFFEAFDDR